MQGVHRDFGQEYNFRDWMPVRNEALDVFTQGEAEEFPSEQWDYRLVVYTCGKYPKVVYQRRRIPTFDSSDRRYDSWHDLFLVRTEEDRIFAVYATGGYEISNVEGWKTVVALPKNIEELIKK